MSLHDQLAFIWFTVFVILLTGYAILDGFDLGVGMLHLFVKDDKVVCSFENKRLCPTQVPRLVAVILFSDECSATRFRNRTK